MSYDIDDYNNEGTLTPGTLLILANCFVGRFFLYAPISIFASFRGRMGGPKLDVGFLTDVSPFLMLSSVLPALLLYVMFTRHSGSPYWCRGVWKHGRRILISCLLFQILILFYEFDVGADVFPVQVFSFATSFFFLIFLSRSKRPRDVFSMFPGDQADT